jgi:hypothetical protein
MIALETTKFGGIICSVSAAASKPAFARRELAAKHWKRFETPGFRATVACDSAGRDRDGRIDRSK